MSMIEERNTRYLSLSEVISEKKFPCVVKVVDPGDIEEVSGVRTHCTFMKISRIRNIDIIVAKLCRKDGTVDKFIDTDDFEIWLPLQYQDDLIVLNERKKYDIVTQISEEMPRFVKVKEKLMVQQGQCLIEIDRGTVLEVHELIPGTDIITAFNKRTANKLRVGFEKKGFEQLVDIPVNTRGEFQVEVDRDLYTIEDAVKRYRFPMDISFKRDIVHHLFAEKYPQHKTKWMTIAEKLRLVRKEDLEVLVCGVIHEDKILEDDPHTVDIVCLPIKLIDLDDVKVEIVDEDVGLQYLWRFDCPRETIGFALKPQLVQLNGDYEPFIEDKIDDNNGNTGDNQFNQDDDYQISNACMAFDHTSDTAGEYIRLKTDSTDLLNAAKVQSKTEKEGTPLLGSIVTGLKGLFKTQLNLTSQKRKLRKRKPSSQAVDEEVPENQGNYEYIDNDSLPPLPTARIQHNSSQNEGTVKNLADLNVDETYERLVMCGMTELAKKLKCKFLDGYYLSTVDIDQLQEETTPMSLLDVRKLQRMRDKNWIPKV